MNLEASIAILGYLPKAKSYYVSFHFISFSRSVLKAASPLFDLVVHKCKQKLLLISGAIQVQSTVLLCVSDDSFCTPFNLWTFAEMLSLGPWRAAGLRQNFF